MQCDPSQNLNKLYQQLGNLQSDFRNNNLYDLILTKITGTSLLDIGCGVGHLLYRAGRKGMHAIGLEINLGLIKLSKELYSNQVEIYAANAEELNKVSGQFDTITIIDVLEHVKEDGVFLGQIAQKINPSGRLIVVVPAYQFLYCKRDKQMGHFRRYSREKLQQKLEAKGFEVLEMRYWNVIGFLVYLIFARISNEDLIRELRINKRRTILSFLGHDCINAWFRYVENKINFGFGLSLLCIATLKQGIYDINKNQLPIQ